MARMARLVVPGHPHHVTQRGVRRMEVFLVRGDYETYLGLLREWCGKAGTEVWAYCLMPNHVHLILVPRAADGLRAALGETHRRYTRHVNFREGWRGHLWQERFHSFVMDEDHLLACARYVELNPVRAKLVERPEDWPWSSAKAHLDGRGDGTAALEPLLGRVADWRSFLDGGLGEAALETLRRHGRSGHPLGSEAFFEALERVLGRGVRPRRPGRPKKNGPAASHNQ
ncbi:MAG: transposase [Proteobacteria bacterium]|nr:transposase [Pseudomonadota bacterium]